MLPAELFRFGLFVSAVVLIYFLAAGILVRLALRRLGRATLSSGRAAALFRRLILGLAALGIVCIAYGFVEPYWPQVTRVRIKTRKLPEGSPPIRIVHISDLHSDAVTRLNLIPKALSAVPKDDLSILLDHYPDDVEEAARSGAELYCAGHTHGGQIALPWYGALITLSKFGKRFEAGLFQFEDMWLYVNRGIGMEGGILPRVRFCSRPEITVIDVGPAR